MIRLRKLLRIIAHAGHSQDGHRGPRGPRPNPADSISFESREKSGHKIVKARFSFLPSNRSWTSWGQHASLSNPTASRDRTDRSRGPQLDWCTECRNWAGHAHMSAGPAQSPVSVQGAWCSRGSLPIAPNSSSLGQHGCARPRPRRSVHDFCTSARRSTIRCFTDRASRRALSPKQPCWSNTLNCVAAQSPGRKIYERL